MIAGPGPDLAAELGLSRSSLREAVRALSLVNILDVRQGDGTYVTSLDVPVLLEALSFIAGPGGEGELRQRLRPDPGRGAHPIFGLLGGAQPQACHAAVDSERDAGCRTGERACEVDDRGGDLLR